MSALPDPLGDKRDTKVKANMGESEYGMEFFIDH